MQEHRLAPHRLGRLRPPTRDAAAGLLGFTAIVPLAFFNGGYFPTAWGVPALLGLWIAAIAISIAPSPLHRREAVALGALAALLAWSALSLLWTSDRPQTVLELERLTIYLAALAAILLVARKESVPWLLGGAVAAIFITCVAGLSGRLFQDVFGRPAERIYDAAPLYEPVGYSNALGGLSAIGVLLLAGFLAGARRPAARAVASAAGVILVAALALALSRGAWIALGAGVLVAICLVPHRTEFLSRLLPLALPGAAVAALGLRTDALITRGSTEAAAVHEGRRLALAIAVLAVAAALLAAAGPALTARFGSIRPGARTALGLGLLTVLVVAVVALWAGGSPERARRRSSNRPAQCDPYRAALPPVARGEGPFWEAAWNDFETHPVLGSGSGSFGRYWLEHRSIGRFSRDAHSVYLETLAELGIVGLALLLVAFATPVVTAVHVRTEPLVPTALGAYTIYLVHAAFDWLWEMPVPTTAALVCGASLLVAGRPAACRRLPGAARVVGVGFALVLGAFSFVGLIGNSATAASERALARGDLERAEEQARRAAAWSPWAAEPWLLLSRTQTERGEPTRRTEEPGSGTRARPWQLVALVRARPPRLR